MKIFFGTILVFSLSVGYAQSFEGTITWKVEMTVTDPATLAKIEQAKQDAGKPETVEAAKKMREKISDPAFQKVMQNDPDFRDRVIGSLMVMEGASLTDLMPNSAIVKFRGKDMHTLVKRKLGDYEILYLGEKDSIYRILRESGKFNPVKPKTKPEPPKITRTSETMTIAGYTCVRYLLEQKDGRKGNYWVTTQLQKVNADVFWLQQDVFVFPDVNAFPMRIEMTIPQGVYNIEVTNVDRTPPPLSDLQIPVGYTLRTK
jgi:hypothetical protein